MSIDLITGSTARRQRREILDDLRVRRLDAVAAPRVLDEGVDVPDANLGIVMSASRTRRQMIQRMGRILRRKRPGVAARFVIMFAKDTLEDPTNRIERDGFLDEIERISEATGVFDSATVEALDAFLAAPGPRGRSRAGAPRAVRARVAPAKRASRWPTRSWRSLEEAGSTRAQERRRSRAPRGSRLPQPEARRAVSRGRARQPATDRQAEGQAQAPVDRAGAARDRAHRVGVADQLHRVRRSVTARPVPVAGPRPDRASAAATDPRSQRVSRATSRCRSGRGRSTRIALPRRNL